MKLDAAGVTEIGSSEPDLVLSALLKLNNAHEIELSRLDRQGLQRLIDQAYFARRIGLVEAFLVSFDQDSDYDNVNFRWFRERYGRFVYIDRVVVAPESRARGHARRLYTDLIDFARRDGHDRIVCEVNSEPPNPGSDAFHASLGFQPVGTASIHGGAKTVRYLSLERPAKSGNRFSQ